MAGKKEKIMSKSKPKKLTPKQQLFCKEYLIDLNATQASIRAGYSKKTAGKIGTENLQKPAIQEEIQKQMDKREKRIEITADNVLQEIAKLGFANMIDYVNLLKDGTAVLDFSGLTRDQAAAIQEITVDEYLDRSSDEDGERVKRIKFKLADKKGSLELLGRHLKLFTDKLAVGGDEDGAPVEIVDYSKMTPKQLAQRLNEKLAKRIKK